MEHSEVTHKNIWISKSRFSKPDPSTPLKSLYNKHKDCETRMELNDNFNFEKREANEEKKERKKKSLTKRVK